MNVVQIHDGDLPHPIEALEYYFRKGGVSLIQAAFAYSYFVHPKAVRAKTPYFPDRAGDVVGSIILGLRKGR